MHDTAKEAKPAIRISWLAALRRTLGSWQAATGASLPMIGRTLAHKNVSTTAIYARLNLDPVRESMQKAATAMMASRRAAPERRNDVYAAGPESAEREAVTAMGKPSALPLALL